MAAVASATVAAAAAQQDSQPRIVVIVNARAGGAGGDGVVERVERAFAEAGGSVAVQTIQHGEDIDRRANEAASRSTVVVAAGGDGTVSAVAAAVVANGGTLGVLPLGTLNHFAKDLRLPLDLTAAARVVLSGQVRQVDVGEVNGRLFLNNSSLGLYPRIVWAREQERRRGHSKWVAFSIAVARTWRRYRSVVVHLTTDGVESIIETPFVFVGNNEYRLSGWNLTRRSSLDAGMLSLYVAPASSRFHVVRLILRALVDRLDGDPRFYSWQLQTARVETSRHRIRVAVDGEILILAPPLRYRIRPRGLRVLVPADSNRT